MLQILLLHIRAVSLTIIHVLTHYNIFLLAQALKTAKLVILIIIPNIGTFYLTKYVTNEAKM